MDRLHYRGDRSAVHLPSDRWSPKSRLTIPWTLFLCPATSGAFCFWACFNIDGRRGVVSTKHFVGLFVRLPRRQRRRVELTWTLADVLQSNKEHSKIMNSTTKRILSTLAIVIASVAFGIVVSADLGLMRKSNAQSVTPIQTSSGAAVTSVTFPSLADIASRVSYAVGT